MRLFDNVTAFGCLHEVEPGIKINYSDLEKVFPNLYEKSVTKGLRIDGLDQNLINDLINYVKTNYKHSCLVFNEMLELYKDNNISVIERALLKDFTFINKKSKRLYDKYESFFNIFDGKSVQDFLSKLDYYMSFMFYIINNVGNISDELKEEYINQVINNLNEISKLDIDRVYLNFNHDIVEQVQLSYQPKGTVKNGYLSRIYYEEQNVYSDVCPTEKYENGDEFVSLFFHQPKFIIKGNRKIGFSLSGNFDSKEWEMTIYNMNFDALLLSKEMLENTMCDLPAYQDLIYMEKLRLFNLKFNELAQKVSDLKLSSNSLIALAQELNLIDQFNLEDTSVFTDEQLSMMRSAEKSKQKVLSK